MSNNDKQDTSIPYTIDTLDDINLSQLVKKKTRKSLQRILRVNTKGVLLSEEEEYISFEEAHKLYEYQDGKPFGTKEEEG